MSRLMLRAAALTVILSAGMLRTGQAQVGTVNVRPVPLHGNSQPLRGNGQGTQRFSNPLPARAHFNSRPPARMIHVSQSQQNGQDQANDDRSGGAQLATSYPYLNAPMYPSPRPDVPHQVGATIITNQALYPQEMLYAHEYRAIYPPFYYRVKGHWFVTPWGVWSNDVWRLDGTKVRVKYRSNFSLFSQFVPTVIR